MDDQVKSRKRPRRRGRVGVVPNLSMRLNPDFSIKDVVTQPTIQVKNNYIENIEELDPRSMDFDTLADMLHPSFIYDYLVKTLHFLQSDVKDLCFPKIAPYKEEFLLKIVKRPELLRSKILNSECEAVATEILQVLEESQHVFQWGYSFDYYSTMDKTVLVYKKLFVGKPQNEGNRNQLDIATPSAVSLTSSLEDMSITTERPEFNHLFKTHILNITMKFIKDDTQLDLKYPELPICQAQYIYTLLHHQLNKEADSTVGTGFKSIFTPLYIAMRKAKESFKFRVSFVETRNIETAQILLRKIPQPESTRNDQIQKNCVDTNQNLPKYSLPTLSRHTSERENPFEYSKRIIASVPSSWVKSCLGQIAKFVADPQRASLEMNMLNDIQASFLELVPKMSEDREYQPFFDYECGDLLTRIGRPRGFKLQATLGNHRTKMKTKNKIWFEKVPDFPDRNPADMKRTNSPPENESNLRSISKERKTINSTDNESSQRAVTREQKSRGYSITFQSAGSEVKDDEDTVPVTYKDSGGTKEIVRWSQTRRVGKLLEAMSTPLESGRAERMMRMMGWDGGALGVRGNGITEPLIPVLHLAPGAGLGHVKLKKPPLPPPAAPGYPEYRVALLHDMLSFLRAPDRDAVIPFPHPLDNKQSRFIKPTLQAFNNRSNVVSQSSLLEPLPRSAAACPFEFRAKLLDKILSFLRAPDKRIVISFQRALKKKQSRFIRPTLRAFNNRINVGLSTPEEIALVNAISEEMRKDLSLQIAYQLSKDKKELYLTKGKGDPAAFKLIKNAHKNKNISDTEIIPNVAPLPTKRVADTNETVTPEALLTLNTRHNLAASHSSAKAARKLAYKLLFLEKIKEFLTNQDGAVEYTFGLTFTRKHKVYIERLVNSINKKGVTKQKFCALENNLLMEIEEAAGDCYVTVSFVGTKTFNTFILHKKYYQKRFINSALDLPPPKSTDVKNTIIYINNVPMNPDTHNNNKEDNSTEDKNEKSSLTDPEDLIDTDLESNKNSIASIDLSDDDSLILQLLEQDKVVSEKIEASFEKQVNIPKETNGKPELSPEKPENDLEAITELPEINYNSKIFDDMIETVDIGLDIINIAKEIENDSKQHKRSLSSPNLNLNSKKYKLTEKYVKITSQNNKDITIKLVKQVQTMISEKIICEYNSENLPCLECYGIQNGGLIYSCQDQKSFEWLQKALSDANDVIAFSTIDYEHEYTVHKIILKLNSFIPINYKDLFDLLERCNTGLNIMDWVVLNEKIYEDCAVLTVNVDENSLNFIRSHNFALYAGVDKIRFSICWD